jgi:hypothetical protein
LEKPVEEYPRREKTKDNLRAFCRPCHNEYKKQYYKSCSFEQKEAAKARNRKYQIELREWISNEVKKGGCCLCGESNPICLDFHHVIQDEKSDWIHRLISQNSRKKLEIELRKCAVVCSNCHRKIHAGILKNPIDMQLKDVKVPSAKNNISLDETESNS